MNTLRRILALVKKELQVLMADPDGRRLIIIPVLLQSILFPLAATLEVKNNTLAVFNEDQGAESIELIQRFARAAAFTEIRPVTNERAMTEVLDGQEAIAVVRFPPSFSRAIAQGNPAPLQLLLDGRRSNSSQIATSYLQDIASGYFNERQMEHGAAPASELIIRHRYNPNLDYKWFILPSLVAIILTIGALITTSLSVARERERGTFEQLLVSPLTPEMIMLGKAIPSMIVGLLQATAILMVAVFVYRVPFEGSLLLLYGSAILYFVALVGVGLLISSFCATQQQAFLGAFSFIMPAILLSGYTSPIENMPVWLQHLTWLNPIRHFIVIVKDIFLKDASLAFVVRTSIPLILTSVLTLGLSIVIFRRRLS
ncbi:MAG: ABC transporter permease [Chthoniobacteraceae bacterium]